MAWNVLNDVNNVVWLLWACCYLDTKGRKEAHTTPTKKEQRHQQHLIIDYVTDMECPDVQIVVAG